MCEIRRLMVLNFIVLFFMTCSAEASYFTQVNLDGFGTSGNTGGLEMKTMTVFKEKLFIGVANPSEGAQVWSFDHKIWKQVNSSGFGSKDNTAVSVMAVCGNRLYAGTTNLNGGEVWSFDGREWRCVHSGRFGDMLSQPIKAMAAYQGELYVGLWDQVDSSPTEIWAYDGEASWDLVSEPGFGSTYNICTVALGVASIDKTEKLYALVWKSFQYRGNDAGCEIWTYDGKDWMKINEGLEGFGEKGKGRVGLEPFSFVEYKGKVYVGLWAFEGGVGWEVWAWDGREWTHANKNIIKETYGFRLCIALTVYGDRLYAAVTDAFTDFELWTYDGKKWDRVVGKNCATPSKFDDAGNKLINSMAVYNGKLYAGAANDKTGYEIWRDNFPEICPKKRLMRTGEKELFSVKRGIPPVRWVSSNEKVVRVDPSTGYCEALASGKTVVSASDAFGFKVPSMEIEVSEGRVKGEKGLLVFSEVFPLSVSNDRASKIFLTARVYRTEAEKKLLNITADLSPVLDVILMLYDDATHGDKVKGDNIFSCEFDIPKDTNPGCYDFKITATDHRGMKYGSGASFTVKQGYSIPSIISLEVKGNSYDISVLFDLKDPDGDKCRVTVDYRSAGGEWAPASIKSKSGWIKKYRNKDKKNNKIAKLPTPLPVNHYIFVWDSLKDIGQEEGKYTVRLIPGDRKTAGEAVVSGLIEINNLIKPEQEMIYVKKGDFFIDKYEYPNRYGSYPETRLTYQEAKDTCLEQGKDLCTSEQWETAYLGNSENHYPYGDDYGFEARDFCNTSGSYDPVSVPSGIYENCVNDIGIYDMGGNVYEWCGNEDGRVFMADRSYYMNPLDASRLNVEDPTHRHSYLGYRCCKSAGDDQ